MPKSTGQPLRYVHIEDQEDEAALIERTLRDGGYEPASRRIETAEELAEALREPGWDLILADWALPHFSALAALDQIARLGVTVPVIIVSGTVGEETAVDALKAGAHNYVMKDRLVRLVPAVQQVLREVAERQALRLAEERLRRSQYAIDHATDHIFLIDHRGRFLDVNESACYRLGYTKEELLAKSILDIAPDLSPAGWAAMWEQFISAKQSRLETRHCTKSGEIYPVEIVANYMVQDGQALNYAFVRDISERKRAEDALRRSQDNLRLSLAATNTGLWEWNVATNAVSFSKEWKRQIGYEETELPDTIETWTENLHPEDRARAIQYAQEYAAHPEGDFVQEFRLRRKDGTYSWIEARAAFVTEPDGRRVRLLGSHIDITSRKQAEAALRDSQDQIREMQKMEALGQLAGGVAHDFNNLLTIIIGNTEIATRVSEASHPVRQNLARILEAGQRASHVVQQILTFARRQDVAKSVLLLAPVVTDVLSLLRATLPAGVELIGSIDAAAPHVRANATQLHQVLMNLCTNAWHALGNQPGRIQIELASVNLAAPLTGSHQRVPAGRYARLSVRDTGSGMSPETARRIFDPFFTTKPVGQGTGLGLSVVQGIVHSHDGVIIVESVLGQGTAFHLYFPAVEAPANEPRQSPSAAIPKRSYRLLYVDDEEMLVELVRALFEPLGYQVTGCTQPREALARVRANPDSFDVVVTDYNMPALSGLEVARELAQIRATLPVVLVSGYLPPEDHAAVRAASIKEIVHKPTMLQELGHVIARLLDTPPR